MKNSGTGFVTTEIVSGSYTNPFILDEYCSTDIAYHLKVQT